jgi:hypothetical protein
VALAPLLQTVEAGAMLGQLQLTPNPSLVALNFNSARKWLLIIRATCVLIPDQGPREINADLSQNQTPRRVPRASAGRATRSGWRRN